MIAADMGVQEVGMASSLLASIYQDFIIIN